ncbi:hypothetical protein [Leptospira weilii]|uniref:hypothetical protein n=1 Tax=Leptospira weilii TaxID=28184 RepID=UPI0002BFB319|nr:hypothetical protein [Leptospira weilii]EMN44974.1 hypothetical protein LEP1GSC086_0141 [Leptospira weilii str. LNT 1234]
MQGFFILSYNSIRKENFCNRSLTVFSKVVYSVRDTDAIRTDNGSPFPSLGLTGFTKLSVWWLKLGI